jgi:osmotically-inducible protein OsmY
MAKSDVQLRQDVEAELRWDPRVHPGKLEVRVVGGEVTLSGSVESYAERLAAETAVKRVRGVAVVLDELAVTVAGHHQHDDAELAQAATRALLWDVMVPKSVTAVVEQGSLTLTGCVDWNFQRTSAERAVANLEGVRSVINEIVVPGGAALDRVEEKIEAALARQAFADAHTLHASVSGGVVTLAGSASSWRAVEEATAAAWSAPGVTDVVQGPLQIAV